MADSSTRDRASALMSLHRDPALLTVVNVWDVVTAKVVAGTEGTKALATASHSIAAAYGYPDGEKIPVDLMLEAVKRIVDSTDLPVTADLEGGYGDAAETVRRAIGIGVVGANIEDQMKPVAEAAAQVEAIMRVAEQEGVDFVLNARTDAFRSTARATRRRTSKPPWSAAEHSSTPAPRSSSFPRSSTRSRWPRLTDAFGPQRLTTIAIPGTPPLAKLEELGVARVSFGPLSLNVTLTALQELVERAQHGEGVPDNMRLLA